MPGFHDKIIVDEDFKMAHAELEVFIYQPVSHART
jgi:hypothetical protein